MTKSIPLYYPLFSLLFFAAAAAAQTQQTITSDMVFIRGGEVQPASARDAIAELVRVTVEPSIEQHTHYAVEQASNIVASAAGGVQSQIDAQEAVGFIRGWVTELGVSESIADPNAAISIVKFDLDQLPGGGVRCSIYTHFSGRNTPDSAAMEIQFSASLKPITWSIIPSVESYATNIAVGGVNYDAMCNVIELPAAQSTAFFRVQATLEEVALGTYLPVRNGISVNKEIPLSGEFIVGGEAIKFVGGVRVDGAIYAAGAAAELDGALGSQTAQAAQSAAPAAAPMRAATMMFAAAAEPEPEPAAAPKRVLRAELTDDELAILMQARAILRKAIQ